MYVEKAKRKGRTQEEVDRVICWLTGYDQAGLSHQIKQKTDFEASSLKLRRCIRTPRSSRSGLRRPREEVEDTPDAKDSPAG
jgi:hypothetical protein